jgi:hypothetical protein
MLSLAMPASGWAIPAESVKIQLLRTTMLSSIAFKPHMI